MSQTIVTIDVGGTGANTAAGALISLGAAPAISFDQSNTAVVTANIANTQATVANTQANFARAQANAAFDAANTRVLRAGDTMTGNLNVAAVLITQNVIPDANVTYDLGSSTARYKDLWLSNSTIHLGEATISAQEGAVSFGNATVQMSNVASKLNVNNDLFVSGNVGIGTSNPNFLYTPGLHLYGANPSLKIEGSANNSWEFLEFKQPDYQRLVGMRTNGNFAITIGNNLDANNQFVVAWGGNIGIGVTAPVNKFQIGDPGHSEYSIATIGEQFGAVIQTGGTTSPTSGAALWVRNKNAGNTATEIIYARNDGKVGIGTTDPSINFQVAGTNNNAVGSSTFWNFNFVGQEITNLSNTAGTVSGLALIGGSSRSAVAAIGGVLETTALSSLAFFTGGGGVGSAVPERMRITSGGNVGIGTTNPDVKFHVQGTGIELITNSFYHVRTLSGSVGQGIVLGYNTGTGLGGFIAGDATGGTENNLIFGGYSGSAWQEVMRIKGGGNVGIGTSSPGSKLTIGTNFASTVGITVDGASASDSQLVLRKSASGSAFGVLAWDSQVYLSAGIYYDGGTWVQSNNDNNNLLFTLDPGGGARWYASNNGSGSWNVSSDLQLWNDSANWTSLVQSTRTGDSYFTGGNVGIATSSPATKLNILIGNGGSDGTPAIRIGGTNNYASLELGIFGGYDGMITSFGNDIRYYSGHWRTIGATATEDHSHYWFTSRQSSADWSSTKMRLDHYGYLTVGQNWTEGNLQLSGHLSGYAHLTYPTLKTSGSCLYFDALGTYTGYICYNGGFTDVSDARLKTNITPIQNGLNTIMGLQGVNYAWVDGRDDYQPHVGFIAQQVREVLPEAVTDPHPHDADDAGPNPPVMGIQMAPIVATLVEAVKELKAQNDALMARISALETQ